MTAEKQWHSGRQFSSQAQFKISRTDSFARDFKSLPKEIQECAEKAILRLAQHHFHPSLRVKKMKGLRNIWEASVTMAYRITFHRAGDTLILHRIGTHDVLKREK
jgi:mRNA interferase RelE/StbE